MTSLQKTISGATPPYQVSLESHREICFCRLVLTPARSSTFYVQNQKPPPRTPQIQDMAACPERRHLNVTLWRVVNINISLLVVLLFPNCRYQV